jgi:DNA-binding response OmpR family regulator
MNKTILIIEDDNDINNMLQILLKQNGYDVISAYSGTEGVIVHSENVSLVLLDLMLPGRNGEDIICDLKQKHNVPVIVMSAIHDVNKKTCK